MMTNIDLSYSPANLHEHIISYNQDTDDIITAILDADQKNPKMSFDNAVMFVSDDDYKTGLNIFNYIKDNIYYKAEPDSEQTTKSIERLLTDKEGDCKHYSLFAGSVLKSLGIPYAYRFVSFDGSDVSHVYIIINPDTNPIYLDAVIDEYNTQEPFKYSKDLYPRQSIVNSKNRVSGKIGSKKIGVTYDIYAQEFAATFMENYPWEAFWDTVAANQAAAAAASEPPPVDWGTWCINYYYLVKEAVCINDSKWKHALNKWEPLHALARVRAKNSIMNNPYQRDPIAASLVAMRLQEFNPSVYNELFGVDYEQEGYMFGVGWENCRRNWYNHGGDMDTDNDKALPGKIVNWVQDNIKKGRKYSELTTAELKPFFDDALNKVLPVSLMVNTGAAVSNSGGYDLNAPGDPDEINGSTGIGAVSAAVISLIVTIIGAIVTILCAALQFSLSKKAVETQQAAIDLQVQQYEDQQEILGQIYADNEANLVDFTADENGYIPAFNSPLALAAIAFGAVLIFEKKL